MTAPTGPISVGHYRQFLSGSGYAGVEPSLSVFREGSAFVKQADVRPLRALGLMDGQGIPIIKLLRAAKLLEVDLISATLEELFPDMHIESPCVWKVE